MAATRGRPPWRGRHSHYKTASRPWGADGTPPAATERCRGEPGVSVDRMEQEGVVTRIAIVQERKTERAFDVLRDLSSPARIVHDGEPYLAAGARRAQCVLRNARCSSHGHSPCIALPIGKSERLTMSILRLLSVDLNSDTQEDAIEE